MSHLQAEHDVPPSALTPNQYPAYAYVLGIYLGDGHLSEMRRDVLRLYVVLDSRYPGIVSEVCSKLAAVLPANRVHASPRSGSNSVRICCYSKSWRLLLPQHGPGPKHARDVSLMGWQRFVSRQCPQELIRGLIHSDGCRYVARQPTPYGTYLYPRYWFTNRSADIIDVFCEHLDLLEIEWTRPSRTTVQVARKGSVARLDQFVGPKR